MVKLSYEEVVEYKITDLTVPGYSITFNLPAELYDLKKMNYDTPDNLIDIRDAHWHGTYYAYAGNETAHFRVLANMFNQKDMEDSWNNITNLDDIVFMSENIFKDLQQNDDYVGIERQAHVVLTINGNEVTYVVYNYTNDKGLESAIIMAGARMGDRYFYTEYRIDGLFKDFNYEELIVNIYQSAVITENSGNDIVTE